MTQTGFDTHKLLLGRVEGRCRRRIKKRPYNDDIWASKGGVTWTRFTTLESITEVWPYLFLH